MTEPTPEQPAPAAGTTLETVAQLAAEAATRALLPSLDQLRTDVDTLRTDLDEVLRALRAAAGPDGNAARLAGRLDTAEQALQQLVDAGPAKQAALTDIAGRLDTAEQALQQLVDAGPAKHPDHTQHIDDLRQRQADLARRLAALERTPR